MRVLAIITVAQATIFCPGKYTKEKEENILLFPTSEQTGGSCLSSARSRH